MKIRVEKGNTVKVINCVEDMVGEQWYKEAHPEGYYSTLKEDKIISIHLGGQCIFVLEDEPNFPLTPVAVEIIIDERRSQVQILPEEPPYSAQ